MPSPSSWAKWVNVMSNIAVIGAGIAGLGAALALSRKGHQVTILERDVPPPPATDTNSAADEAFFDWDRKGAGQFRHPHAFLGLLCNILKDNYPDLLDDFEAAGARTMGMEKMIPPAMRATYVAEPGDERLWIMMCRRATMETVLRNYAERQDGITIKSGQKVTGLVMEGVAPINVTGVMVDDIEALYDIVVDASGRTTKFTGWLRDQGATIEVEDEDAELVYFTRHYKLNEGSEEPSQDGPERSAGDLGYLKYGIFPGEEGHFAAIICAHPEEVLIRKALNNADVFHTMLQAIPGAQQWVDPARSTPTTDSFGFADIHTVWRHYVNEDPAKEGESVKTPVATNFFAVGDATLRTNPLYGRGCAIGMHHAHIMAQVLTDEADPIKRAILLDERTEDALRPIFNASQTEDRNAIKRAHANMQGNPVEKPDSLKAWFGLAFGAAIGAAAQNELHVLRGSLRTFQLEEKPGEFLQDKAIRNTVLRYMLRGRKKNASASIVNGPDRDEMLGIIAGAGMKEAAE
jgi:2-polyprenyl-6-methoxyphenol hydroxylase-like FAD-dependent oxidoreductase